jgi:hypothetical protein
MLSWDEIKGFVVFALAIWGAGLSTYTAVREWRKQRRAVKVLTSTSILTDYDGNLGPTYLQVRVVNAGSRPVTIGHITLQMPDGKWMANASDQMHNTKLPTTLNDGEEAVAFFDYKDIVSAARRHGYALHQHIRPLARDTLNTIYRGSKEPLKTFDHR